MITHSFTGKLLLTACLLVMAASADPLSGQATIVYDPLDNASTHFTVTNASGYYTGDSPSGYAPASSPYAISGYGLVRLGGEPGVTATLVSAANINTYGFENIELSLRLAAFGTAAGRGLDPTDFVAIDISIDGGSIYTQYLIVNGNDNASWAYSATGLASAVYGTPATFAPSAGGGERTTDGYSTLKITGLPAITNLRVRIRMFSETGTPESEFWVIDDFRVTGDYLSPITTGAISGSPFCVTSSAGAAVSVSFTSEGTFSDNTFTAQLSDASGSFVAPTAIGTLVSDESSGTISATIPAGTATGTGYRIRVLSSNPEVSGPDNGTDLVINLAANSVAPAGDQSINAGVDGTELTVTEQSAPSSRQWYYGTTPGGPYPTATGVATATYTPNFEEQGTYYIVCVSEFACATITSNEVKVTVSPTVTTGTVSGTPFCVSAIAGAAVTVPFTSAGTFTSNTYTAWLSDASGSFDSPVEIGSLVSNDNSGNISATIPAGTATGTGYRIRVTSSSPALTAPDNGSGLTVNLAVNSIAPSGAQSLVAGIEGTLLTVTEQSVPSSRQWYYGTASGGPYSTATGVTTNTYTPLFATQGTYYVVCISVFACETVTSNEVQVVVSATVTTGAISGSPFCITATEGVAVTVPFTSAGVFSSNTYTAQLSDASGSFDIPVNIGTLGSDGNSGNINGNIPAGTASGSGYRIRVISSSPALTGTESAAVGIVNGVSDVSSPAATPGFESVVLSWTNPSSCFQEVMVVASTGSFVSGEPSGDGAGYTADLEFGSGQEFYGGYILYKGVASPQTVTGLANGTTYYFTFFTRNGTNWSPGAEIYATPASYPGNARWAVSSGDWASESTWSDMPGGSGGATVPADGGNVYITGDYSIYNVPARSLNSLNISGNCALSGSASNTLTVTSNLEVASGKTLTLGGATGYARMNMTLANTATGTVNGIITWPEGSETIYTFTNNGTLIMGPDGVIRKFDGSDDRTVFVLSPGATLSIGSPDGIVQGSDYNSPGNIRTYTRVFDAGANYIYSGTGDQVTGNGLPPTTTGQITIAAGAVVTPNHGASTTLSNSNLITINGALTIPAGYTLESTGSGSIAINSGSGNSGSLIVQGTINAAGRVTYNRSMPEDALYHYITSPVTLSVTPSGTFYPWDEPSGEWGTATGALVSGNGYAIRGGTTLSFTGSAVTSNTVIEASSPYSDLLTGGETEYERTYVSGRDPQTGEYGGGGWNLLGNPFTSAMLVTAFIDENFSETPADNQFDPNYVALYIYNGSAYQYVTSDETGWNTEWPDGTYLNATHLQAGQGFFVLAMNDDAQFTFTPAMQDHSPSATLLKSARTRDRWPGLRLKAKTGDSEGLTTIIFGESMSTGLDPRYDIGMMDNGSGLALYTALTGDNGVNFARQALPVNGVVRNVVPVGIDFAKGGSVTFSAETEPFRNYRFWLEDRTTGIMTDLGRGSYTVSLPAKSHGTGRFFVHVSAGRTLRPRVIEDNLQDIRIWSSGNSMIHIQGATGPNAVCEIFDARGRLVHSAKLTDGEYNTFTLPSLRNGVYMVRVTDSERITTGRVVLVH